ncbi:MAG: GrpB family protein [Anaerolineae bacterium]
MSSSIRLVDYDPKWPILYEEEKASILGAIGDFILDIQHIGSTAVPGLGAKPIIDIMVAIRGLALIEKCIQPLQTIGYEYRGEYGIPGRHFFRKPPGDLGGRTHHLHMVERESDFWERHILFRDSLRAHPEEAQRYYELKKQLAAKFVSDRDAYTDAKTSFIESVFKKAHTGKTTDS